MSAADLAAVLLTVLGVAGLVLLALTSTAMVRAARSLRRTAEQLEREALPLVEEARACLAQLDADARASSEAVERAEAAAVRLGGASRLVESAVASPVLKVMAVGRGVKRAAGREAPDDGREGAA